jgi:D-threo-aldose 1-dehydrogenase
LFAPLDDDTAAAALAAAWDGGIRYFDTSPHYGIGHSERRTGDLLRGKPRAEYTLSTKVGRLLVPQDPAGRTDEGFEVPATHRRVWDFSRNGVMRSVSDSLARLGTGRIDVLFLHDAEDHFEAALRDGYPALRRATATPAVPARAPALVPAPASVPVPMPEGIGGRERCGLAADALRRRSP